MEVETPSGVETFKAGAIVQSTGAKPYDANKLAHLGYGVSPNVVTSHELEAMLIDGKLAPGEIWRQESIVGGMFEATYGQKGNEIVPSFTGTAYVTAEATLILDPEDPFRMGIRT